MDSVPVKGIPHHLRDVLLGAALRTDIVAEFKSIEPWRMAAILSARWLLRIASELDNPPKNLGTVLRNLSTITHKMSDVSSVIKPLDIPQEDNEEDY